jgi:hypothetical protein
MIRRVTEGDKHNSKYTYHIYSTHGSNWYDASTEEGVKVLLEKACKTVTYATTPTSSGKLVWMQRDNFHEIITMYNRKKILESLDKKVKVLS